MVICVVGVVVLVIVVGATLGVCVIMGGSVFRIKVLATAVKVPGAFTVGVAGELRLHPNRKNIIPIHIHRLRNLSLVKHPGSSSSPCDYLQVGLVPRLQMGVTRFVRWYSGPN